MNDKNTILRIVSLIISLLYIGLAFSDNSTSNIFSDGYGILAKYSTLNIMENKAGYLAAAVGYSDGNVRIATDSKGEKFPAISPNIVNLGSIGIQGSDPCVSYFRDDPDSGVPEFMLTYISPCSNNSVNGTLSASVIELHKSKIEQIKSSLIDDEGVPYASTPLLYNIQAPKEESGWDDPANYSIPYAYYEGIKELYNEIVNPPKETTMGEQHTASSSCYIGQSGEKYYFSLIAPKAGTQNDLNVYVICYDAESNSLITLFQTSLNEQFYSPSLCCPDELNNGVAIIVLGGMYHDTSSCWGGAENNDREVALSVIKIDINQSTTESLYKNNSIIDQGEVTKYYLNPTIIYNGRDSSQKEYFSLLCINGIGSLRANDPPEYYSSNTMDFTISYDYSGNPILNFSAPKEFILGIPNILKNTDIAYFPHVYSSLSETSSGTFIPFEGYEKIYFYAVKNCTRYDLGIKNIISGPDLYIKGNYYSISVDDSHQYIYSLPDGYTVSKKFSTNNAVFEIDDGGQQSLSFVALKDISSSDITYTDTNGGTGLLSYLSGSVDNYKTGYSYNVILPVGIYLKSVSGEITSSIVNQYGVWSLIDKNTEKATFIAQTQIDLNSGNRVYGIGAETSFDLSTIIDQASPHVFTANKVTEITFNIPPNKFVTQLSADTKCIPIPTVLSPAISFESKPLPNNFDLSVIQHPNANTQENGLYENSLDNYCLQDNGVFIINDDGTMTNIIQETIGVSHFILSNNINGLVIADSNSSNISVINPTTNICTNLGSLSRDTEPVLSIMTDGWNGAVIKHSDGHIDSLHIAGFDSNGVLYYTDGNQLFSCTYGMSPMQISQIPTGDFIENCELDSDGSIVYVDSQYDVYRFFNNASVKLFRIPDDALPETLTLSNGLIFLYSRMTGELYVENPKSASTSNVYEAGNFKNSDPSATEYIKSIYDFNEYTIIEDTSNQVLAYMKFYTQADKIYCINIANADTTGIFLLSTTNSPQLLQKGKFLASENNNGLISIINQDSSVDNTVYTYSGSKIVSSGKIDCAYSPVAIQMCNADNSNDNTISGVVGYSSGAACYFFNNNNSFHYVELLAPDAHLINSISCLKDYYEGYSINYADGSNLDFNEIVYFLRDDGSISAIASKVNYVQGQNNTYDMYFLTSDLIPELLTDAPLNSVYLSQGLPYMAAEGNIYSLDKNGNASDNPIVTDTDANNISHNITAIAVNGNTLYYADDANNVYSCPISGGIGKILQVENGASPGVGPSSIVYNSDTNDITVKFVSGNSVNYSIN